MGGTFQNLRVLCLAHEKWIYQPAYEVVLIRLRKLHLGGDGTKLRGYCIVCVLRVAVTFVYATYWPLKHG